MEIDEGLPSVLEGSDVALVPPFIFNHDVLKHQRCVPRCDLFLKQRRSFPEALVLVDQLICVIVEGMDLDLITPRSVMNPMDDHVLSNGEARR